MTDIERLAMAMQHLMRGWHETSNGGYSVAGYTVSIKHEALLAQLGYAALIKGSGEPQYGSNPNKSDSRPPGNAAPLNLLERISEEAHNAHNEALELRGLTTNAVRIRRVCDVLHLLTVQCIALQHEHPREVARYASLAESWVRAARLLLGYERRTVMLRDVVCDQCGGALSVPVDASGDVTCVGKPYDDPQEAEQPCGRVYPQWSWPDLLASHQGEAQDLWTTRDAVAYLVRERPEMRDAQATRWLYNQAREHKITNYGSPKKALWNSQEVLDQMSWFVGA